MGKGGVGGGQTIACFSLLVALANMEHSAPNVLAQWKQEGTGGAAQAGYYRLPSIVPTQKVQPVSAAVVIFVATQAGERT